MKVAVRTLAELGSDLVFAPERWVAAAGAGEGIPLGDLVIERRERVDPSRAVVLDTTHARDGVLDIPGALRAAPTAKSSKKLACAGDLVVSRLRPYLRQIAFVHPRALESVPGKVLALSSEFYVLSPRRKGEDIAFLLPFLLGDLAQSVLAAAQEGGHHPRVPRSSLFALRVPERIVAAGARQSREVSDSLAVLYGAIDRWQEQLVSPRRTSKSKRPPARQPKA